MIISLDDFFEFGKKEPINRLAYTKEDIDYKIKVIEKMQELGMKISIDKIGNICGTISIGTNPSKTLAMGSHTDSVYDGGQYDGPVGVIVGLQTVESLLNEKDKYNGIVKVAIYACEESSRFGNACLGSKFLKGNIPEENFNSIVDQKALKQGKTITLRQATSDFISYLKEHVKDIEEVDKIFDEVDYSLEIHIEQYELLKKQYKKNEQDIIGIVNSVGSAVRIKYDVQGKADHTGSTPMKKRHNAIDATAFVGKKVRKLGKKYEKDGLGRASQVEINTPGHNGSFNQIPSQAQGMIDFRLLGENTPDKVLSDFQAIQEKVEEKTKTKITTTVVSKGAPIITSKTLNTEIANVCNKEHINFIEMPSYAGQDTGYIPAKEKTMIFIPSTGGSHNPKESTKKKFIETATRVFTNLSKELLVEKFKDKQTFRVKVRPVSVPSKVKVSNLKKEKEFIEFL